MRPPCCSLAPAKGKVATHLKKFATHGRCEEPAAQGPPSPPPARQPPAAPPGYRVERRCFSAPPKKAPGARVSLALGAQSPAQPPRTTELLVQGPAPPGSDAASSAPGAVVEVGMSDELTHRTISPPGASEKSNRHTPGVVVWSRHSRSSRMEMAVARSRRSADPRRRPPRQMPMAVRSSRSAHPRRRPPLQVPHDRVEALVQWRFG